MAGTGDGTARITIKVSINGSKAISLLSELFIPGNGIDIHKHSNEAELIFIHKGTGIFTPDGKEYKVGPGAVP